MNINIDSSELKKFSNMAADWWDPLGECRPLHELNPVRLQFINDRCPLAQKKVLDIGCGGGILSESMAKRKAKVVGIDALDTVIEVAKQHASDNGLNCEVLHYEHSTAEAYAEHHRGEFDVITCMELLEHVPDPLSLIKACQQLLKPNGHLFLSTVNRTPKSYAFAILGAEYLLKLLPKGTHDYEKFIRPSELASLLRQSDLQLKELQGIHYNPFKHTAHLNTNVDVNYLAYATKE